MPAMVRRNSLLTSLMPLAATLFATSLPRTSAFVTPTTRAPKVIHSNTVLASSTSPFDALKSLFAPKEQEEVALPPPPPPLPDVVIEPDFRLAGIFLGLAAVLDVIPYVQILLGIPVTLLGLLFLVQTLRVRFVFDKNSFSVKTSLVDKTTGELQGSGENFAVGGENRWAYKSFVNYDFFPKGWIDQPQGPILVYFKENQTPEDTWFQGPGQYANSEEALANGAEPGQVHFFPSIGNPQQIREEFERRGCAKL